VAILTINVKYIASVKAIKEAVWICSFINDLYILGVHIDIVPLYINNNLALKLTRNPEFYNKLKYINIKHHFIYKKVEKGVIYT
jgi:hypothetical protein